MNGKFIFTLHKLSAFFIPDPIWIEITKKTCSLTCKNANCAGKLFWNDGDTVDVEMLNAAVDVSVVDPPGTTECSSRHVEPS